MYSSEREYQHWDEWRSYATKITDIPGDATRLLFYRENNSHRGISSFGHVTKLGGRQVNQEFLCELAELSNLTYLELDVVTAEDLSPLENLTQLTVLKLDGVRKADDFEPLIRLPALKKPRAR